MTPLRALIAGIIAAILWGAGLFIATSFAGGRPHDLVPLLSLDRAPFELFCFLAAWGALIAGALGVLTAFLAFIAPEEEDDPRFRRRGFPKAAPLVLIALALGLAWFALRCKGEQAEPIPVAIEPQAEIEPVQPVAAAAPIDEPAALEPLAEATPPAPVVAAASYQWPYKIPLVGADGASRSGADALFLNAAEADRLLCGKAWVAVTGSASEEGPDGRNRTRARLRAEAARDAASRWIDRHPDCGLTIVFGVSLGQHAYRLGESEDGAASAYQRQALTVSRARARDEAPLARNDAEAELKAFLADPRNLEALYAGRDFPQAPEILKP